ncbi:stress-activated protein kinase signaling cascade [Recurvomyces mirabilis]|nr:stress-activated protein kinase signaling cascade [Recurvomyces mirabilis]
MEPNHKLVRTAEDVRCERATNRVFGLKDAERWSGCKQYIDFLDDLFTLSRRPSAKFHKLHDFVIRTDLDKALMLPYVELVSLECFTLWRAES